MSLSSLVKRLVLDDESNLRPAQKAASPVCACPAPEAAPHPPPIVLCRDEIVDAQGRICGYRFHAGSSGKRSKVFSASRLGAGQAESVAQLARQRMALIPIAIDGWSADDFRPVTAANTVFLVAAPADSRQLDAWLAAAAMIKACGARIAVEHVDLSNAYADALSLADMMLLDLRGSSLQDLESLIHTMTRHYPNMAMAVENVISWPEYRMCTSWGVRYCLGGFIATADAEEETEQLGQSRIVLLDMLNLLRGDAGTAELAAMAKRDPGVAMQVIAMANSALLGRHGTIANVDQAIMRVGREWLYRSLSIALFKVGGNRPRDEALLELALARARFMELVATDNETKEFREELFIVGLLSLIDRLLNQPMAKIVGKIRLPDAVVDALLRNDGPYATHLALAIAVEKGDTNLAWELAAGLEITPETLEHSSMNTLEWVRQTLGHHN